MSRDGSGLRDWRAGLAAINRRFYQQHGDDFDRTRRGPWQGWRTLVDRTIKPAYENVQGPAPFRVLDLGCGNGRFYDFLRAELTESSGPPLEYLGVDESPILIAHAQERYPAKDVRFQTSDLLEETIGPNPAWEQGDGSAGPWDLVVCFGVFHHVPTKQRRRALFQSMLDATGAGGIASASFWHFSKDPRIKKRAHALSEPWTEALSALLGSESRQLLALAEAFSEPGDFLLPWGNQNPVDAQTSDSSTLMRFCHDPSAAEILELSRLADERGGLSQFLDDGRNRDLNEYLVASL